MCVCDKIWEWPENETTVKALLHVAVLLGSVNTSLLIYIIHQIAFQCDTTCIHSSTIDRVPKWECQYSDDVIHGKKWLCERKFIQRRGCELAVEHYYMYQPHLKPLQYDIHRY